MMNANLSPQQIDRLIRIHLKGSIEIKHLAMQFNCSEQMIEDILIVNDISIESNKIPKEKSFWKRKRRK